MGYLANALGDANDLGFFATPEDLSAAYPVGAPGYFALVGSTDTIWIWDEGTSAWVDSGAPGANAYVYIAYASDDSGTDFTNTFNPTLDYIAIKSTNTAIPSPIAADFAGLWKNYKGAPGTGTGDVNGPATNTDNYIPQWDGANSKTLKNGLAVPEGGLAGLTALATKIPFTQNDIIKDPTGFENPQNVIVTYNSTTRKITLTGTISAYYRGVAVTSLVSGWESDAHDDTVGVYFLYYNGTNFIWGTSFPDFSVLQIAVANYRAVNPFGNRECHGFMPWECHKSDHYNIGTYRTLGGDISNLVLSSVTADNRRPIISECTINDEDLPTVNAALTSKKYSQRFMSGASDINYTLQANDIVPLSTNRPYYNSFSTPNFGQTLMPDNSIMTVWLYEVPVTADSASQEIRHVFVQGQSITQAANSSAGALVTARNTEKLKNNSDLNLGLPSVVSAEYVCIHKFIIQYTASNWSITDSIVITGSRSSQVSYPSGNFLTEVTTDATLTGAGTVASPLAVANPSTGTNTGDNANNTTSNSYADGKVEDAIVDGVTTKAPSQNAVFDALAGKQPTGSYLTSANIEDSITNGVTDKAPSENAVFDALVLKLDKTGGSLSGSLNEAKGTDIASASSIDIGAGTGNMIDITGTTTITALGTVQAGTRRILRFTGILTLTHNATSLILPTGANIVTQAGDTATMVSLGSGNWVCTSYQRKDGSALAGGSSASIPAFYQEISTRNANVQATSSDSPNRYWGIGSKSDGSVYFDLEYYSNTYYIRRMARDSNTGQYFKTHEVSYSMNLNQGVAIVVVGSYVYLFGNVFDGGFGGTIFKCLRFSATDLSGVTTMSMPTIRNDNGFADIGWTDGTYIYLNNDFLGRTIYKLSISGSTLSTVTTNTYSSSYTFYPGSSSVVYDGSNYYLLEKQYSQDTYTIYKSNEPFFLSPTVSTVKIGGYSGAVTGNPYYNEGHIHILNIDTTKIYIGSTATESWSTDNYGYYQPKTQLRPVSKP